jgi:hypothetical protein
MIFVIIQFFFYFSHFCVLWKLKYCLSICPIDWRNEQIYCLGCPVSSLDSYAVSPSSCHTDVATCNFVHICEMSSLQLRVHRCAWSAHTVRMSVVVRTDITTRLYYWPDYWLICRRGEEAISNRGSTAQVHSLFQSQFSTQCDLVLPLSISNIFSFP